MKRIFMSMTIVAAMFAAVSCACGNNSKDASEADVKCADCTGCDRKDACQKDCDGSECADCDSTSVDCSKSE